MTQTWRLKRIILKEEKVLEPDITATIPDQSGKRDTGHVRLGNMSKDSNNKDKAREEFLESKPKDYYGYKPPKPFKKGKINWGKKGKPKK